MKFHFISIGGAVMHNLALALHNKGYQVTGSDDEIFEPAKSRLAAKGLLPENVGWYPEKLHTGLDAVILGMHARKDNPELAKAHELGLKIYSFPEFLYNQSVDKKRIVIGGSHGKTTSTAMLMHVLKATGRDFDYMVGSQLTGFDTMVKLTHEAPVIVLEGDEYLTSPLDLRPKFHLYHPQMAMITGIAWDHINVFPTWDIYVEQFRIFIQQLPAGAPLAWFAGDETLKKLVAERNDIQSFPYDTPIYKNIDGKTHLTAGGKNYILKIFGEHNLQNMEGVKILAMQYGLTEEEFYTAMSTFAGTARRLEMIYETSDCNVYRDFAHSPSKLKATTQAVKRQFPERKLTACFELHTFSSLNKNFLSEFEGCMDEADVKIVFFNPHVFEIKKMELLTDDDIKNHFGKDVICMHQAQDLLDFIDQQDRHQHNLLLMSSGDFDGAKFSF